MTMIIVPKKNLLGKTSSVQVITGITFSIPELFSVVDYFYEC